MKNYLQANMWKMILFAVILFAATIGWLPHEAVGMGALPFMALSTSAFPINAELSAIAIGYKNHETALIADQVMPRVDTAQKFKYTVYNAAQAYTVPDTKVGRKSEPNMVDFGGTEVTAETEDFGLDDLVPNSDSAAFEAMSKPATGGPLSPIAISSMMLSHLVQLDREIRVANMTFNGENYQAANQAVLSGSSQWSDPLSNPLDALLSALDVPIIRPNTLVIGQQAWTKLRQHPRIVQAIGKSAQTGGNASRQEVADLLEIKQIFVGAGFLNTAKRGQTPTMSRVWGKHASLINIDTLAAQIGQPTFAFTAQFGTRIAGTIDEPRKGLRGGTVVRVGESVKEVISCQDAGYFFQNVVG